VQSGSWYCSVGDFTVFSQDEIYMNKSVEGLFLEVTARNAIDGCMSIMLIPSYEGAVASCKYHNSRSYNLFYVFCGLC
jgi:hypothetical protein